MPISLILNNQDLDFTLAFKRVQHDSLTDLVFAPHYSVIFHEGKDELERIVKQSLRTGQHEAKLPITIEVPKQSGFCRPGSILSPADRITYQVVVDSITKEAEGQIDRSHVFSNVLIEDDQDGRMFKSTSVAFLEYKQRVLDICNGGEFAYVLKIDIASFYERINLHILENLLLSAGCKSSHVKYLNSLLLMFNEKNSQGIIQGVLPSDFLGNFSLCFIDTENLLQEVVYTRYVDDINIFFRTKNEALAHQVKLGALLRCAGLTYNESKTMILNMAAFKDEQNEIDSLFSEARMQIENEIDGVDTYEAVVEWGLDLDLFSPDEEIQDVALDTSATQSLFNKNEVSRETRNKIDKFCIPIFIATKDTHGLDYVINSFCKDPSLAQLYAKYLGVLINTDLTLSSRVETILERSDELVYDYQWMWLIAALMVSSEISNTTLNKVAAILRDQARPEALRAVCTIFVAKF